MQGIRLSLPEEALRALCSETPGLGWVGGPSERAPSLFRRTGEDLPIPPVCVARPGQAWGGGEGETTRRGVSAAMTQQRTAVGFPLHCLAPSWAHGTISVN